MKKIIFLVSVFCLSIHPLYAQIILNNDTTVCSMQSIDLLALSTEPSSMSADDSHDTIIDIGFIFSFYGQPYTQLVISGNGYITFDISQSQQWSPYSIGTPIPNPGSMPENAIMAPWQDINAFAGGGIYYGTTGLAPNRMFIVTWCEVPMFSCASDLHTSQVVLYEGSSKIEMFLQNKPLCIGWNGGAAVHGLVDATSANFDIVDDPVLFLPRNWPLTWTATNEGWEFIPSGVNSYTINALPYFPIIAGAVTWSDAVGNVLGTGSSINVTPVVSSTYFATMISNCSGTLFDSILITVDVSNNSFDTIYADSMVFNAVDTGVFVSQTFVVSGCDTVFVDSVIHQRLGVQINYNINNPGTATFTIDGLIQTMPYSQNYWAGETISIVANLQPDWAFVIWRTNNNAVLPNSNSISATFSPLTSDSCVLVTVELNAFIFGNDTICDNAKAAKVNVDFKGGDPPFTFVYAIDGISQPSIKTTLNPYIINTKKEGVYTLLSFSDTLSGGRVLGSALVTVLEAPIANFEAQADSMTILYTTTKMFDKSIEGDTTISSWNWNFGDNTPLSNEFNPFHTYAESIGFYQVNLIINDNNGCSDTTFKQVQIRDDYWMYIPNSFTPDLDGINDVFCIQFHGVREETFYFNVYDRFSALVYATANIKDLECELSSNGWDGKHQVTGNDLPIGSYIYEIYFKDCDGWKHQESGQIIIVR